MSAMLDYPTVQDDVLILDTPETDSVEGWKGNDTLTEYQAQENLEIRESLASPDAAMSLNPSVEVMESTTQIEDTIKAIVEEFKYKDVTFEAANRVYLLLKLYYLFSFLKDIVSNPTKIDSIFNRLDEVFLNLLIQTKLIPTKGLPKDKITSEIPAYIAAYGTGIFREEEVFNLKFFATKIVSSLKIDKEKLAFSKTPFPYGSFDMLQLRSLNWYTQSLKNLGMEKQKAGTEIKVEGPNQELKISASYTHQDKIVIINEIAAALTHSKDEVFAAFGNALLGAISVYQRGIVEQ